MSAPTNPFATLTPLAPDRPRRAYIEPTDRCNTRCLHCRHYHRNFGTDMPEAIARKAVAALAGCAGGAGGADVIVAQGYGEPLIARAFYIILDACRQRNTPVAITTNGILLHDEALVRRLVRAPVHIVLSIDGARPETFHFVRPAQSWERLLESLALYQRCRREAGAEAAGSLSFHCVAMKDTVGDLPELVRMAHRYGAGSILVQALAGDNGLEQLRGQSPFAAPEVVGPALLEAMAVARELGVKLDLPRALPAMVRGHVLEGAGGAPWQARLSPAARRVLEGLLAAHTSGADKAHIGPRGGIQACRQPWDWTFIASDGVVHACCMRGPVLGNLATQEWDAIWNGQRYQSFRRLIHGWNPPLVCRRCILPEGINAGDDTRYDRYFGQFRAELVDGGEVMAAGGFRQIETETGQRAWRLDGRAGTLTFPSRAGARFLALKVAPAGEADLVTGTCTINHGDPEPFDLSCQSICFPVEHVGGGGLEARFEMADPGSGRLEICAASLLV